MNFRCLTPVLALAAFAVPASAQEDMSAVEITAQQIAPGISVLFGQGGNMAVAHGDDGTILIDDQFAPLTPKIEAAIAELGAEPVHYLINTHFHFDHTGGNENFGKQGAHIFAHENVRARMGMEFKFRDQVFPPSPKAALPVVTYERGLTLHLNDDTIDVMFLGGGHTDGDSVVIWREKNVVHMGDLYFNVPGWPFVDARSGGSIAKMLFSLDSALAMMNDQTVVIPGHGAVSNKAEMTAYRNILGEAVTRIRGLKGSGVTLEDAQAQAPLASFERGEGFFNADAFIASIWESL